MFGSQFCILGDKKSETTPCERSAHLGSFPEVTALDTVAMGLGQLRLSWWEGAAERPCDKQGSKDKKDQGLRFQYTLHKPTLNGLLLSSLRLRLLNVPVAIGNNSLATKPSTLGPLGVFKIHTPGAGEMAQWLRAPSALPEVLSSIPSNHMLAPNHL